VRGCVSTWTNSPSWREQGSTPRTGPSLPARAGARTATSGGWISHRPSPRRCRCCSSPLGLILQPRLASRGTLSLSKGAACGGTGSHPAGPRRGGRWPGRDRGTGLRRTAGAGGDAHGRPERVQTTLDSARRQDHPSRLRQGSPTADHQQVRAWLECHRIPAASSTPVHPTSRTSSHRSARHSGNGMGWPPFGSKARTAAALTTSSP
jgi:hypothetical protein